MEAPAQVALFRLFPELASRIGWVRLGDWPTPVEPLVGLPDVPVPVYVKREDQSNSLYGGNKVRTLEAIMGFAVERGAESIWVTGAYGSNHATATVLHAPKAGLRPGLALFSQPPGTHARANLSAMLSKRPAIQPVATPVHMPPTVMLLRRRDPRAFVMAPGGAVPRGTFGALSAGLELAGQIAAGQCPQLAHIVLAVGSTCTTAGLLAGLHVAHDLGIAFPTLADIPRVTAVRVTPWPLTSPALILRLAYRSARHLAELTGIRPVSLRRLHTTLTVERRFFGAGYGQATVLGLRALRAFAECGGPPLDLVYSAKSAAALLRLARSGARGPMLFWATKSSAPLPRATAEQVAYAPARWRRWLGSQYLAESSA